VISSLRPQPRRIRDEFAARTAAVKDGRAARVEPPKSNGALPIDTPPYYGYRVACGITFTFGGVRVDARARVLGHSGQPVPGLHAAGEMVGGLFAGNYRAAAG